MDWRSEGKKWDAIKKKGALLQLWKLHPSGAPKKTLFGSKVQDKTAVAFFLVKFTNFRSKSLGLVFSLLSLLQSHALNPPTRGPWQAGPWRCILPDGSYSPLDYSGHRVPLYQAAREALGFQEHPAGRQVLGLPSYHSRGGRGYLTQELKKKKRRVVIYFCMGQDE